VKEFTGYLDIESADLDPRREVKRETTENPHPLKFQEDARCEGREGV